MLHPTPIQDPARGKQQTSLDDIGLKYGTDKASWHHDYLEFYERFLHEVRGLEVSVMEIGVLRGQSIAMWAEYFQHGKVVGLDINPATKQYESDRIHIEIADQSNPADLARIAAAHGPFDLIVDDGSHIWDHQITTLRTLLPFVKPGRYYILEDIDTSYGVHVPQFKGKQGLSAAKYLQTISDFMVGDAAIDISNQQDALIRVYARRLDFIALSRRTSLLRLRD
jgi:cephalosporin hydroxylase